MTDQQQQPNPPPQPKPGDTPPKGPTDPSRPGQRDDDQNPQRR